MEVKAMNTGAQVAQRNGRGPHMRLMSALVMLAAGLAPAEDSKVDFSGFAWTEYLQPTEMYKGAANFDYNPFFTVGGMVFMTGHPSERWTTNVSLGVAYGNTAIKRTLENDSGQVIGRINPHSVSLGMGGFLHEANVAFATEQLSLKIGRFHYVYSDYNHNMGLYLLRGPVYPGLLYSGFQQIGGLAETGVLFSWSPSDNLRWDILPSFETDFKPFMDINLSSFLTFRAGLLELGAGVEMQRLVEFNSCLTSPTPSDVNKCLGGEPNLVIASDSADYGRAAFYIVDTTGGTSDTVTYSMAGTKVMFRGALDFKKVMGEYSGSAKDWVLYFEAALLGVKDYKYVYEKKGERIPVLVGMNFPTFGLLDLFSLEVEYYNAQYQNDQYKLAGAYDVFDFSDGNTMNFAMSPIPASRTGGLPGTGIPKAQEDFDAKKDNLKWSLLLAKKVQDRITFKFQLASDHWRMPNNNFVQYEAAAEPGQFYGSMRVDYAL